MEVIRRGMFTLNQISATNPSPPTESASSTATDNPPSKKPRIQGEQADAYCSGCGKSNHTRKECAFVRFAHPDHNTDNAVPWRQSTPGKAWKIKGFNSCPVRKTLDGQPYAFRKLDEFMKSVGDIGK